MVKNIDKDSLCKCSFIDLSLGTYILKQFFNNILLYSNFNIIYYIFCSLDELSSYENKNIKIINDIKEKKWLDRIKWDLYGLRSWREKRH